MISFLYWAPVFEILVFMIIDFLYLGKGYSIIKVFNFVWLLNHLTYALNLYDYYEVSERVLLYSLLFICVVNTCFLVLKKPGCFKTIEKTVFLDEIDRFNTIKRVVCFVSIVAWIISIPRFLKAYKLISAYGMVAMRDYAYDEVTYTTVEKLAYNYFVQPVFVISIIFATISVAFKLYNKKKSLFVPLIVSIINAFLYSVLFGGRSLLILIVFYLALGIIISSGFNLSRVMKMHKVSVALLLLLTIPIVIYSAIRVTREWGPLKEFGLYMTGGLGYLSQADNTLFGSLHGKCTFGCIYDTFGLAFQVFGGEVKLASQYYSDFSNPIQTIGNSINTNFTATSMGAFLLDFDWGGIVIGGCIYGAIFSTIENGMMKKPNIYKLALYLYFSNCAIESIQNYTFKSVVFFFLMVFLYLLFHIKFSTDKFKFQ